MQTATMERRGSGRPPRAAPKQKPMKTYAHTFTDEGYSLIDQLATRMGMSQSAFLEYAAKQVAAMSNAA